MTIDDELAERAERVPLGDPQRLYAEAVRRATPADAPSSRRRPVLVAVAAAAVVAVVIAGIVVDSAGDDGPRVRVPAGPPSTAPGSPGSSSADKVPLEQRAEPWPTGFYTRLGARLVRVEGIGTVREFGPELPATDRPELAAGNDVVYHTVDGVGCGHDVVGVYDRAPLEHTAPGAFAPAVDRYHGFLAVAREIDCAPSGIVDLHRIGSTDTATLDLNANRDGLPAVVDDITWIGPEQLVVLFGSYDGAVRVGSSAAEFAFTVGPDGDQFTFRRMVTALPGETWTTVAGTGDTIVVATTTGSLLAITFPDTPAGDPSRSVLAELPGTIDDVASDPATGAIIASIHYGGDTPIVRIGSPVLATGITGRGVTVAP